MRYDSLDEVMQGLAKKRRTAHLLLGNGFSMAYDPNIFSYNALYDFVSSLKDQTLEAVFGAMKTKNFELMMEQLNASLGLLKALGAGQEVEDKLAGAIQKLKDSLIGAIKTLHPEHVFKIPEERSAACAKFIDAFTGRGGRVFTTNYDLLLYWILMRQNVPNSVDGFGKELLNPVEVQQGTEAEAWSELTWGPNKSGQNIFYTHGALPLFDTGAEVVKEQYREAEGYLLENIGARLGAGEYPIFVAAGSAAEKLAQIRHNRYLSHCYDQLCELDGSVVTLGFGFGEYDDHIIDALNKANHYRTKSTPKLWSIYIGTFSDKDEAWIASIEKKFHAVVHTFDAKTANIWG
jgi:hypothetical protein